ncbi:MAG TPA: hypothetical protein DCG90_10945 [Sphingobium sp.]|uniref:hypothetical protein n=1 Tax=unclassified Sphingobium TaxID=2611147 RepID=UPI0007F39B97|nr:MULTISPECIES: hypothetical protein [unclassified Sphingobium]OAN59428.1 hypothetical protein A7Q26_01105 [Sphingobium sp. TCM1]WIW90216.1 hypothetical protein K3M67_19335 [Sphingobium sp. V4]HAF42264.1 hypothetical protein [Sphingobium sp.]
MTSLSRRGFMAGVALASTSVLDLGRRGLARTDAVLLHDPGLVAGRRFAVRANDLGGAVLALEGDRVRQMRQLLARAPAALFGISRHADEMLVGDIVTEAGYRRVALVRHGGKAQVANCAPDGAPVAVLARLAGTGWPEAFAELALGGIERCGTRGAGGLAAPAFSWIFARREGG